jgi:negative regulator of sigma E activity
VQTRSSSVASTELTTMTEEYMQELERRIDNMMQRYELYRIHQDRVLLECMVADYEAKMKLKLKENA